MLPYANFDAKEDCEALRKAMKGLGMMMMMMTMTMTMTTTMMMMFLVMIMIVTCCDDDNGIDSGTDEDAIIGVLTNRSVDQRVEVANMFKTMFGKVGWMVGWMDGWMD